MKISKFRIQSDDLNGFVNFLIEELSFDYENHSPKMTVLTSEEYYFRNNSSQLNMIVAKIEKNAIEIDVIAGAGGSSLLNINWGSERGYIRRVTKVLKHYAKELEIELEMN